LRQFSGGFPEVLFNLNQINRIWFQHCFGGIPEVFRRFSKGIIEFESN
jgi:hypothetical protein